jgi:sugar phosphate permease
MDGAGIAPLQITSTRGKGLKRKIFYGWWVVASVMPSRLIQAGALFYIFGIFYKPLLNEFGWSRGKVATALTIYLLSVGLFGSLIGKLTDLFGAKKLIGWGAFFGGILFFLLSRINTLRQFYLLYFLHGIAFSCCGNVPVNTALTNWFERRRGSAIGIAMAGVSLGAIIITPTGGFILEHFGWRNTYIYLALITWLLVLPPTIFVMKNKPQDMGLLPDGEIPSDIIYKNGIPSKMPTIERSPMYPWTLGEILRIGPFWLICIAYVLLYIAIGAVLGHQIVYLTDMGISMATAAAALGATGGMGGIGKIVFGVLSDKFSPKKVTVICAVAQGVGIILLLCAKSMPLVWLYAIFFGFCMGGHLALQPIIVAYFFGVGSFGTIYGIVLMAGAIGSALGPMVAGACFDLFGTYNGIFAACVFSSFLAAVAVFCSKPVLSPEQ